MRDARFRKSRAQHARLGRHDVNVVSVAFADEKAKGFYNLPGLKFVLFEPEESLRKAAKATAAKIVWEDFVELETR